MPKNSELSKSPKVVEVMDPEGETIITMEADPAGTSEGRVMRSSRLAGMSVVRVTVLTISAPY
jgi:hypothetical protein